MQKIKALILANQSYHNSIDELNSKSPICEYRLSAGRHLSIPPETLIIIFELIQNLSYSASYDLLKAAILEIGDTFKKKKSKIIFVKDGKRTEITLPFELDKEQQDKVVDAVVKQLLS